MTGCQAHGHTPYRLIGCRLHCQVELWRASGDPRVQNLRLRLLPLISQLCDSDRNLLELLGEMATTKKPATEIKHVFRGTFIHSTQKTPLEILEGALLGVDGDGKVCSIIL